MWTEFPKSEYPSLIGFCPTKIGESYFTTPKYMLQILNFDATTRRFHLSLIRFGTGKIIKRYYERFRNSCSDGMEETHPPASHHNEIQKIMAVGLWIDPGQIHVGECLFDRVN